MLAALGLFIFEMGTLPFTDLDRRVLYRHEATPRFGALPAVQFVGPGEDSISLTGLLVPELAGTASSIDTLRAMAADGEAWPLVAGDGRVLGNYVIRGVDDRQSELLDNGTPRKIDFAVDLFRVS